MVELSVVAVVELWVVDDGGIIEWSNLEMKWNGGWWLVLVEWWYGGYRKSCLCVPFSRLLVLLSDLFVEGCYRRCGKRQPTLKWNGMMAGGWWHLVRKHLQPYIIQANPGGVHTV